MAAEPFPVRRLWPGVIVLVLLGLGHWLASRPRLGPLGEAEFVRLVEECSENPRPFISDNWVSNETDYGCVLPLLRSWAPRHQVYIGVGPEQNFSYIAAVEPCYAFVVDIRRGNLLQHLYYKVLFEESDHPRQWLARLLGRSTPPPADYADWLLALKAAPPDPDVQREVLRLLRHRLQQLGLDLRKGDWEYLRRMQSTFAEQGLGLRFSYYRRQPDEPEFPTFHEVLLARDDRQGYANFLASPEAYQRLRHMQLENRIIPLMGDFASWRAFSKLSRQLRQRNLRVGLFYASNVEFYLMPKGLPGSGQEAFVFNLEALPSRADSLILRTELKARPQPHLFVSHLQRLQPFVRAYFAGQISNYRQCLQQGDLIPPFPEPATR